MAMEATTEASSIFWAWGEPEGLAEENLKRGKVLSKLAKCSSLEAGWNSEAKVGLLLPCPDTVLTQHVFLFEAQLRNELVWDGFWGPILFPLGACLQELNSLYFDFLYVGFSYDLFPQSYYTTSFKKIYF